jgi:hypothetical protein
MIPSSFWRHKGETMPPIKYIVEVVYTVDDSWKKKQKKLFTIVGRQSDFGAVETIGKEMDRTHCWVFDSYEEAESIVTKLEELGSKDYTISMRAG